MKILVINPGATSTKIAVFDEDQQLFKLGIDHSAEELDQFERVIDQADYRKTAILNAVTEAGYKLSDFAAVCGRGGLYRPIPSGTYAVNDKVMHDVETAPYGEHPSNLGAYLAKKLGDMVGIPAFFVDPVCVDEMTEIAHYTGFAEFRRLCQFHALNHKAVGRKGAGQEVRGREPDRLPSGRRRQRGCSPEGPRGGRVQREGRGLHGHGSRRRPACQPADQLLLQRQDQGRGEKDLWPPRRYAVLSGHH